MNDIAVLSIERDLAKELDLNVVVNNFSSTEKNHRKLYINNNLVRMCVKFSYLILLSYYLVPSGIAGVIINST